VWLRLEAAVVDDPERVAIREGLAFGEALQELLRLPLVAERGQPTGRPQHRRVISMQERLADRAIPAHVARELAELRAENARLRRLLKLSRLRRLR
jgi:hypothetical protein